MKVVGRTNHLTLGVMTLLVVCASLVLASSLSEQQARQTVIQANELRQEVLKGHLPDLSTLETILAQLETVEQNFGEKFEVVQWTGPVPEAAKGLDLRKWEDLKQYRTLRRTHPDWPDAHVVSAALCLNQLRVAKAIAAGDVPALLAFTNRIETSAARAYERMATALAASGGKSYPDIATGLTSPLYKAARARLLELRVKAPALLLVGNTPLYQLEAHEGDLFLPVNLAALWLKSPYTFDWNSTTKSLSIDLGNYKIIVTAGKPVARVMGREMRLSTPPLLKNGHLLISVRDVKPLFGLDYKWDSHLRVVRLFASGTKG